MSHRLPQRPRPRLRGWASGAALLALAAPAHAAGDLVLIPHPPLMLALIVLFALMVLPVNQLVFKPLLRVLDERDEKIAGTRTRAEQLDRETDEVLTRYESQVAAVREEAEQDRRALLESARGDAQGTTGGARSEAEQEIERARSEIASALDAARDTLRTQSQELARQAAASVLGRPL
ncbi:MAG: ATP synthase F0 subunit B [Myxococcota bacterium]